MGMTAADFLIDEFHLIETVLAVEEITFLYGTLKLQSIIFRISSVYV